jgi:hypothetical protein
LTQALAFHNDDKVPKQPLIAALIILSYLQSIHKPLRPQKDQTFALRRNSAKNTVDTGHRYFGSSLEKS